MRAANARRRRCWSSWAWTSRATRSCWPWRRAIARAPPPGPRRCAHSRSAGSRRHRCWPSATARWACGRRSTRSSPLPAIKDAGTIGLSSAFWRSETRTLNGTRSLARRMMHGLEEETGRRDLRFLTLLTWSEVLSVHQLQKTTRAWCPGCFQDWRDRGHAIYDPLLWTLAPVTVGAHNKRPLLTICPFPECRRPSPWLGLGYRSRPGHCAHCGGWLGSPGAESSTPEQKLVIEDAVRSHAWIFDALGKLIAATPSMPRRPQREDVLRGIEAAFRLAAFRMITIDRRSSTRHLGLASGTVLMWREGRTLPSLWSL